MFRLKGMHRCLLASAALAALWTYSAVLAQEPAPAPRPDPEIQLVQQQPPVVQPPVVQPPVVAPPVVTEAGAAPEAPLRALLPTTPEAQPQERAASGVGSAVAIPGGTAAPVLNASDVSVLLSNSPAATGVEIQQRSPIVGEPKVRGYRVGQIATWGNHGYFLPARLDLDTAISKFDPGSVRDVFILKGPYSARYGPAFSIIDIDSFDTPRYAHGFQAHGRSALNYDTNGPRWGALQSAWGGGPDWGFRATYDYRTGDDYRAGDGRIVPSSYNSQTAYFAFGYSLAENARVEFKGLRLIQQDVEFPGLYFDITDLDTEAYSLRFTLGDQPYFDRLTLDLWYNYTGARGDTLQGAKQTFLSTFLTQSFRRFDDPRIPAGQGRLLDFSTTTFSESSRGYRLATGWGGRDAPQLTVGTDFNYVKQRLDENIRIFQPGFMDPQLSADRLLRQDLGIPRSHLLDPGVFVEGSLPVTKRLRVGGGGRADFVFATSHNRFVGGNVILRPGTNNPLAPGQIPAPGQVIQPVTGFDPILFSAAPFNNDLSRNFDLWSAYVTADYAIDEHLTSFVKFGHAQRPPTLTELYAAGPFIAVLQQGLNRLVGDPNLQEERLTQVDVGLQADYQVFRAGVVGFYAWIDDYITFDQIRTSGTQLSQVVYTNTDEATLAGGEIFAQLDLTERLTPFMTASYVQGRDLTHVDARRPANLTSSRRVGDTEPLPGIPPLEIRGGFLLHEAALQPRWSLEFSARSVMGQNLIAASLSELPTSGFTIFDLRGFWQVNQTLLLTGGVENIGDKFYREHLDPRSGFPTDVLFRPGVNFYAAAEMKY